MKIILKTWSELESIHGSFTNENNMGEQEIHLLPEDYYISTEYKNVLGKEVATIPISESSFLYTREYSGFVITPSMHS